MEHFLQAINMELEQQDAAAFAAKLGASFTNIGFAVIANHGLDAELLAQANRLQRELFALPLEQKTSYYQPLIGGARGYTPFGVETAKGAIAYDLKEFWHIGRELPQAQLQQARMHPNIWPQELPDFQAVFTQLYQDFDQLGERILSAIALYLGRTADFFKPSINNGNSLLRLLHYPPVKAAPIIEGSVAIRAGAHEDINTITLLLGAEEDGLELLTKSGQWLRIKPKPGELVVNIGDMLARYTNGMLRSTTHRVVNPNPERSSFSRYSMPFFLHFHSDFLIETLPECVTANNPCLYPEPITADEFLQQRLREIKLIRT